MPRQTSIQLTEATERQVQALSEKGFGSFTDIARIAIDRMYRQEIPSRARRFFQCNASGSQSIYDAVRERFGDDDYAHIRIVETDRDGRVFRPVEGHRVIGSTTAHAGSGPWFALLVPDDMADDIIARNQ